MSREGRGRRYSSARKGGNTYRVQVPHSFAVFEGKFCYFQDSIAVSVLTNHPRQLSRKLVLLAYRPGVRWIYMWTVATAKYTLYAGLVTRNKMRLWLDSGENNRRAIPGKVKMKVWYIRLLCRQVASGSIWCIYPIYYKRSTPDIFKMTWVSNTWLWRQWSNRSAVLWHFDFHVGAEYMQISFPGIFSVPCR